MKTTLQLCQSFRAYCKNAVRNKNAIVVRRISNALAWLCCAIGSVFAVSSSIMAAGGGKPVGVGVIANNLFDVGLNVRKIVQAVCIITGTCLIVGAMIQYKKYRQNPAEVKLSTLLFTLIVGLCLIALTFIPMQGV